MAYLEARAGIARAGVTYAGWAAPRFTITVGGTVRTTEILRDGFTIQRTLNNPASVMRFRATDWVPVPGQRVTVDYCTPEERLFGGFIARQTVQVQAGTTAIYDCEVVSDVWLLDFLRPYGRVHAKGLRPALEWLVGKFTIAAPSITVGSVPSSMADIAETTLDGSRTVSQVISDWVSQTEGAYWRLCPVRRAVDVFTASGLPDGNGATLIDTTAVSQLVVQRDLSQVATRVYSLGAATTVTATTAASGTTTYVPVEDTAQFLSTVPEQSGTLTYALFSPHSLELYTNTSVASGTGSVVATQLQEEYPQGLPVRHATVLTDTTAAEALALLMSSHAVSGVAERWLVDERAKPAATQTRGEAYLAASKAEVATLRYLTTERWVVPGQTVVANITAPLAVAGTFVVQAVVTTPRGRGTATRADLWHEVTAVQIDRAIWARLVYATPPTVAAQQAAALPVTTPPGFLSGVR